MACRNGPLRVTLFQSAAAAILAAILGLGDVSPMHFKVNASHMIGCPMQSVASVIGRQFIRRFPFVAIIILLCAFGSPGRTQQSSDFDKEKLRAHELFFHGRLQESIKALRNLIQSAPSEVAAANLQRDIIEICTTGAFINCYIEARDALSTSIQTNKDLFQLFYPELMLYIHRERIWFNDQQFVQKTIELGGPAVFAPPQRFPATFAELQLALHTVYVNKNDLRAAEEATASAVMGLLLSDPRNSFVISKILVGLINARLARQDIAGAFQLLTIADPYLSKSIPKESVLYANYIYTVGTLFSYTTAHAVTATTLQDAARLYEKLDIDPEIREFSVAGSQNLASAALAISDKLSEARDLHAKHPLQPHRDEIITRGQFKNLTEFYFALLDIFLAAVANERPDARWKELFIKEPDWNFSTLQMSTIHAYRSFALATLELGAGNRPNATRLFIEAAVTRIDIFEKLQRANFEGFQLPSIIDRLIISAGLKFATDSASADATELILRGGEVLTRTLRHSLTDDAVLLASQPNDRSRKNAHSYINLLHEKRDWELKNIKTFIETPDALNKGALIQEYTAAVTTLSNLKSLFINSSSFVQANGLATVRAIQNSLAEKDIFIAYAPTPAGIARLCIDKTNSLFSVAPLVLDEALNHAQVLQLATTASHAPDRKLDSQYPVNSAIYLNNLFFGGLEKCMKAGSHAIVALPPELAGVPVAALLPEAPPSLPDGFDLTKARWLIKEFSFSFVVSPRQYLAVVTKDTSKRPPLSFLGIGNPTLGKVELIKLGSALLTRIGSPKYDVSDLAELPETALELRNAAAAFGASERDLLLAKNATEEKFRSKPLFDYDVIHIATHGFFTRDLRGLSESSLILTPVVESDSFDDGLLSASEISRISLRARLVILSACNSAQYDQLQANLGVHDLQAAFTLAGAPTILASLWPVDSEITSEIMMQFIRYWRSGTTGGASSSHAAAIRHYLSRADRLYQHPRFWAPFIVAGNGAVVGTPNAPVGSPSASLMLLDEFKSGGEISSSEVDGTDIIFSLSSDWDGKRMAGTLSRRRLDGTEKWRVTSREIATGQIAIFGGKTLSLGYKGVDHFTPVIRSFDRDGRLLWRTDYSNLLDYFFSDIAFSSNGTFVVALPAPAIARTGPPGLLLKIDGNGKIEWQKPLNLDRAYLEAGNAARISLIANRIVIAIYSGVTIRPNLKARTILGLAPICIEDAKSKVLEFDNQSFELLRELTIDQFLVTTMANWDNLIYLGGELRDGCSARGNATIIRIPNQGQPNIFWKDSGVFPTRITGMAATDKLSVVLSEERILGIRQIKALDLDNLSYNKRSVESATAIQEGSLLEFSKDGSLINRRDMSAGLSLYLGGVRTINRRLIVHGMLGGQPGFAILQ